MIFPWLLGSVRNTRPGVKNSSRFFSNSFPKIIRNGRNKAIYHVYDNRIASDDLIQLLGRPGVIRVLHVVSMFGGRAFGRPVHWVLRLFHKHEWHQMNIRIMGVVGAIFKRSFGGIYAKKRDMIFPCPSCPGPNGKKNLVALSPHFCPKFVGNGRNKIIYHVHDNRLASDGLNAAARRPGVIRICCMLFGLGQVHRVLHLIHHPERP